MSHDEDTTARLLHLAGPRPDVPAERAARVREAVHERWQIGTRRRRARRAVLAAALAATAAVVVLLVRLGPGAEEAAPRDLVMATVERVEGTGALKTGAAIRTNEWIETSATSRVALRLKDGTSVRVDSGSVARLLAPGVIELTSGAVYLDTGRDSTALEVRTAFGTAHDIGTQFEVRLDPAAVRVRVRSGVVELRRSGESLTARAGTELTVSSGGATRRAIPANAPDWTWAANLAPVFEIEGRTVAAFLEHTAREQGWTLHYADARLTRDSAAIVLHGSVAGLPPQDAVAVALSASGLGHRLDGEDLHVFRDRESQ
jgi:FecR protein